MKQVIKVDDPRQISQALEAGCEVIRLGEEFCFHRAQVVWPVEVVAASLELLRRHNIEGELAWLVNPTSIEEEKYHQELAALCRGNQRVKALISDWGNLKRYRELDIIAGERLLVYNSPALRLLKELNVNEFYLPPDLSAEEIVSLTGTAGELNLLAAYNSLPPALLVSWTCIYRETTRHFSRTCLTTCHPDPPAYQVQNTPLFKLDGHVVKALENKVDRSNHRQLFSRRLVGCKLKAGQ